MVEDTPRSLSERIERALSRIEAALAKRDDAYVALARRNNALRHEISGAITALDHILAPGDE